MCSVLLIGLTNRGAISTDVHKQARFQDTACAYVAHFRNLIYPRVPHNHASQYERNVSDWLWTLTLPAEQQH